VERVEKKKERKGKKKERTNWKMQDARGGEV
jgi:hypothetical protein